MANKKRIPMTFCLTFSSVDKILIGPEEKYDIPYTFDLVEMNLTSNLSNQDETYFYPSMEAIQENGSLINGLLRISTMLMKYDPLVIDIQHAFIDSPDIHGLKKYSFIFLQFLMMNAYKYCISLRIVGNDTVPVMDMDIRYYVNRLHKSLYLLVRDFKSPDIESFAHGIKNISNDIRYIDNINNEDDDYDLYEQLINEKRRLEQINQGKEKLEKDRAKNLIKHKSRLPLEEKYIWTFTLLDKEISEYLNVRLSEDELKYDEALTAVNIILEGVIPLSDSNPDEYKDILLTEQKDMVEKYVKKSVINYC